MIHWAWLIPVFVIGAWCGSLSGDKASRGFGWGVIASILAFIGLN